MVAFSRRGWIPSDLPPCCEASPPKDPGLEGPEASALNTFPASGILGALKLPQKVL